MTKKFDSQHAQFLGGFWRIAKSHTFVVTVARPL